MAETIGIKDLRSMIEAQNYTCALTGDRLTPQNATADHIVPVVKGGRNTIDNIQIVTTEINHMKGNMTNEEFVSLCARVVDWSRKQELKNSEKQSALNAG